MCSGMHTLWFGCPPSSRPVCLPHVPPPCSYSCAITLLMHPAPLLLTHACQCTLHCLPLTHACRSSPATRSYGFAIILLTVLVKLATYPLTAKQVLCAPSVAACRRLVWPGLFCCSLSWLQCWGVREGAASSACRWPAHRPATIAGLHKQVHTETGLHHVACQASPTCPLRLPAPRRWSRPSACRRCSRG